MTTGANRSWMRAHFSDHPGLFSKDATAKSVGGKAMIICKYCLALQVAVERGKDGVSVQSDDIIKQDSKCIRSANLTWAMINSCSFQ